MTHWINKYTTRYPDYQETRYYFNDDAIKHLVKNHNFDLAMMHEPIVFHEVDPVLFDGDIETIVFKTCRRC